MKFLIVSTVVPFIEGGGTFIVDWLSLKLREYGHQTDVLKLPFHSYYPEMLEQMLALRLLDVGQSADRMIAIRTPSYLLQHDQKFLWFIHHHRGAYDLWGTAYQDIPSSPAGVRLRESLITADNQALQEAKRIYTNSKVVSERIRRFNGFESEVVYPPLFSSDKFNCQEYGDFIFYPSRLTHHKRQHLAIEAMKYTRSGVRLVIAGNPESPAYFSELKGLISKHGLEGRVKLIGAWISEEEKRDFFAHALAGLYIPLDEDSYGYPTLEAFFSKKSMITCSDSGGTLEIVRDGCNGKICAPDPKELADAFDDLFRKRQLAMDMGKTGLETIAAMKITWDNVVEKFTR